MRKLLVLILFAVFSFAEARSQATEFEIRGVLPWHNFLSGPSAWNEKDYAAYLDDCVKNKINFIGFHNYTGGGERYATYVEPMIRISYRNILPTAYFDNSLTSRWGYYPLKLDDFAFGTKKAFKAAAGMQAFGADCSVSAKNTEAHYRGAQQLMKRVLSMAHARKIQFAMGFEFGVLPPEYYSLTDGTGHFYWPGESNMIPNPAHPLSVKLLYATIDNILETYKGIDWIWLWLNEHSFMGVDPSRALQDTAFNRLYQQDAAFFEETAGDQKARFVGVWSLEYMRLIIAYLHRKAPEVKIMLGGWGGGNQLPMILRGLDRSLPKDIVFSCLNPGLGQSPQPDFLEEIAKHRKVIAVPWLEGDHQLWHDQPRVKLLREHVQLAARQRLDGVIAIHWRTRETRLNMKTFAHFASHPSDTTSVNTIYWDYLKNTCGIEAANQLAGLFTEMDTAGYRRDLASPEFYAYTPKWGRISPLCTEKTKALIRHIEQVMRIETNPAHRKNLQWYRQTYSGELLLDETGRCLQPAFDLRNNYLVYGNQAPDSLALHVAMDSLNLAPLERLFAGFAAKAESRGELGELSAMNQKLWTEYQSLVVFLKESLRSQTQIEKRSSPGPGFSPGY